MKNVSQEIFLGLTRLVQVTRFKDDRYGRIINQSDVIGNL